MRRSLALALFLLVAASVALAAPGDFVPGNSTLPGPWVTQQACPFANPNACWTSGNANALRDALNDLRSSIQSGANISVTSKDGTLTQPLSVWEQFGPLYANSTNFVGANLGPGNVTATGSTTPRSLANRGADVTNVLDFGAKGDGVTDDMAALRAATIAAGQGGTLLFPPGHTYLTCGGLRMLQGQTVQGYGATVRRCNSYSSATSTNIATGSSPTSIVVANASGFAVGQEITVFNGGSYDAANHTIASIVGNTLSVGTNFTTAFPGGGTVVRSFNTISNDPSNVAPPNVSILGLTIDGNAANNNTFLHWELNNEIRLSGDHTIVRDVYIHDAQSEGIQFGGKGSVVEASRVENSQGNGIHLSGTQGAVVRGNRVVNCNIAGSLPGHADGCVIASNGVDSTIIDENYISSTTLSGVASWDSQDNSTVVVSNNTILNAQFAGFEGYLPQGTPIANIIITGNNFGNDGPVMVLQTGPSAGNGVNHAIVANNILTYTPMQVKYSQNVTIANNQFTAPLFGSGSGNALYVYDADGAQITGNEFDGWDYGIYVDGVSSTTTSRISVSGNSLKDQYTVGVKTNIAAPRASKIDSNTITQSPGFGSSSYQGIATNSGWFVTNNTMDLQGNCQYAIACPNAAAGVNGDVVTNNWIKAANSSCSVKIYGAAVNNWVIGNFTSQAIQNGNPGSNTVTGNYSIFN